MSEITLTHVTYYQNHKALFDNLNLQLNKKKITCLIGPNGSGKSTLLKLIAGLLQASLGEITLEAKSISAYSRKDFAKKLAYLPQQCVLPNLPLQEYVALGRFCHQTWFANLQEEDHNIIHQAIALTDLQSLMLQPVNTLSGGQQQRARLALILAQQSEYLLLDEPLTGLDLKQQIKMLNLLLYLQKHHQKTILMTLHDIHQAAEISDEVIFIKNGVILNHGKPEEVIHHEGLYDLFDYHFEINFPRNGYNNFGHRDCY